jgi:hypothetical protein
MKAYAAAAFLVAFTIAIGSVVVSNRDRRCRKDDA